MVHQIEAALDLPVLKLRLFVRVVVYAPSLPRKLLIEVQNKQRVDEVDKGVPHVCVVVIKVHRHVEEVIFSLVIMVYFFQYDVLAHFVR